MKFRIVLALVAIVALLGGIGGILFGSYQVGVWAYALAGSSGALAVLVGIVAFVVTLKVLAVLAVMLIQLFIVIGIGSLVGVEAVSDVNPLRRW